MVDPDSMLYKVCVFGWFSVFCTYAFVVLGAYYIEPLRNLFWFILMPVPVYFGFRIMFEKVGDARYDILKHF